VLSVVQACHVIDLTGSLYCYGVILSGHGLDGVWLVMYPFAIVCVSYMAAVSGFRQAHPDNLVVANRLQTASNGAASWIEQPRWSNEPCVYGLDLFGHWPGLAFWLIEVQ